MRALSVPCSTRKGIEPLTLAGLVPRSTRENRSPPSHGIDGMLNSGNQTRNPGRDDALLDQLSGTGSLSLSHELFYK